ncbi:MAG: hypothetical protein KBT28_01125 [Bacteroidales bacterium]|nr:hypothetical protein [Candidatus Colimorpha merdihippi]
MKTKPVQIEGYQGDIALLHSSNTIAFLCSHTSPVGTRERVVQWIQQLPADSVVLCGNLTGIEQMVIKLLAERGIRVVLVLATALENKDYGFPLVITPIAYPEVSKPTARSSAMRNELMISHASNVVVGFMAQNGNLARQLLSIKNYTVLMSGQQMEETRADRLRYNAEQMGWAIYNQLKEGNLPSIEMRKLLVQYLRLEIERPSMLHSMLLYTVLKKYAGYTDFNFTSFFEMWGGVSCFRADDWKGAKTDNGKFRMSLAEKTLGRLMKALPSKFRPIVCADEQFKSPLAHALLDPMLGRKPQNKRYLSWALKLAFFDKDHAAIDKYKSLLGKK